VHGWWADFRLAARLLAKDRRFTFAAVVALALGIGLNTSVFAIVNAALLRDLPFAEPDRLVAIQLTDTRGMTVAMSYADLRDWRDQASTFEGLAANAAGALSLSDDSGAPVRLRGSYLTANAFQLLRTAPILGRGFVAEDEQPGAPGVLVLGYGVWQSRYGSDPSVIGRTVRVDDAPATIVGVMPPGFKYPYIDEAWQSISSAPNVSAANRGTRNLGVVGRLKPGVILEQARAELQGIVTRLAEAYPATNTGLALLARPMRELYPVPKPMLATMMGAVTFVLLIGYANIANLLLARSASRSREMAIRAALGASRWRIVRQLLVECLLIALMGGALGFVLSIYGANEIASAFDIIEPGAVRGSTRPYWVNVSPDSLVYGFAGLLSFGSALAFGLLPAWQIARTDVNDTLKEEGRGTGGGVRSRRWSSVLLTAQLALTLILLAGAGLLWRGFIAQYRQDTVIDTSGFVTMRLALPARKYRTAADRKQFLEQLDERISSLSLFSAATMASHVPLEFGAPQRELFIEGVARDANERGPIVAYTLIGERYFEALHLPIVRGRALTAADARAGQEGVVVDERFANQFSSGIDPIGRRIRLGPAGVWFSIVGVARTVPQAGPPPAIRPMVYAPLHAEPAPEGRAAIIVKGPLAPVAAALREIVRALDPTLPLFAIETVDASLARGRFPARVLSTWFGALALAALVLAAVGVFAMTAHSVAQRTHEIGVRMALGADSRAVVRLFARRTIVQLVIGLVLGIIGALGVSKLVQAGIEEAGARDPVTFAIVAALLTVVAMTATLLPARRASRVDPAVALRT
jgi:predicted permease